MKTKLMEATNGPRNWGKFLIARFDVEWEHASAVPLTFGEEVRDPVRNPLLVETGWNPRSVIVFDLQTGEGARFTPGGVASYDLNKHKVWVCPLFEPFLEWLYEQNLTDLDTLPDHVDLPDAPFAMSGYRRSGEAPPRIRA